MTHLDPHKLTGCLIVTGCAALVAFILLCILASSAHADVQGDACLAMNVKPCPAELPIVRDDAALYGYGGSRVMGANTGGVIYLRSSLNLERCYGKQYRFHEDVHTVQLSRGYQSEDEAYRLQREYYVNCMEANHD